MEIEGYENYLIYEDGRVWSKTRKEYKITTLGNHGYKIISLWKKNKGVTILLHRLIAKYFIPNPNNYDYVDHINRDRQDNRIENLRWVTASENNVNRPVKGKIPHKNISIYGNRYDVSIKREKVRLFRIFCKTLEEALLHRNAWFIENGEEIPD